MAATKQQRRDLGFEDYIRIIRRRIVWIALPAILVPVLVMFSSFVLPARYTSTALILIERQTVSGEIVHTVVTDDLNSRISNITERIFSRSRLEPILQQFGLYANSKASVEDKLVKLRKDVVVKAVRSDLARTNGLPGFTISVDASSARVAQQVCRELSSMFLSENLKAREASVSGTTDFLNSQLADSKRNLDEQESKLAAFQRQYIGQLPGQEQTNLNILTTLNTQLEATVQAMSRLGQDKTYIEAMLAQQTSEHAAVVPGDPSPQSQKAQLEQLQSQLVSLRARYTADHPSILKLNREIDSLQQQMTQQKPQPVGNAQNLAANVESPQIKQMRAALRTTEKAISDKKEEQERIQRQVKVYQSRIQLSPLVEEQSKQLTRDHETALRFYNELLTKKNQSGMATDLEHRQQGEQFRMVDPPNLPQKPTFPNRPLFAAIGIVAGLMIGSGIGALREYQDKSLRNERDIFYFTKLETLAVIPLLSSSSLQEGRKWQRFSRLHKSRPVKAAATGGR